MTSKNVYHTMFNHTTEYIMMTILYWTLPKEHILVPKKLAYVASGIGNDIMPAIITIHLPG